MWHMDYLKLSYQGKAELKKLGNDLKYNFRYQLMEYRGNIHDYLGINLNYLEKEKFKVSMTKYLHKIIIEFS